jgi:hypothetical protein
MGAAADMVRAVEALDGLKEGELNELGVCALCHKQQLAPPNAGLTFYKVTISRGVFSPPAIQRQAGLGMMLGGNAALARIMGPDEDLAKIVGGPKTVFVHERCAADIHHLVELFGEPRRSGDGDRTRGHPKGRSLSLHRRVLPLRHEPLQRPGGAGSRRGVAASRAAVPAPGCRAARRNPGAVARYAALRPIPEADRNDLVEIVGFDGDVHYRRPFGDPMIEQALRTPGYSVRGGRTSRSGCG